jgi:hypothetical protein
VTRHSDAAKLLSLHARSLERFAPENTPEVMTRPVFLSPMSRLQALHQPHSGNDRVEDVSKYRSTVLSRSRESSEVVTADLGPSGVSQHH